MADLETPPCSTLNRMMPIAEAMAAYRAGQYVSHARVREWLAKLAKGERVPPPEP